MKLIDQSWTLSTGSTAGTVVNCFGMGDQSMVYVECDAGSSVNAMQFETALSAGGPFATVASTSATTTNTLRIMQFTGPLYYVRPRVQGVGGTITVALVTYGAD